MYGLQPHVENNHEMNESCVSTYAVHQVQVFWKGRTLPCMMTAVAWTASVLVPCCMPHNVAQHMASVMQAPNGMHREPRASVFFVLIEPSACSQGMQGM